MFLKNCIGCSDCICCVNLINKNYYIFNQEYTKDEYETKKQELLAMSRDLLLHDFQSFSIRFPKKFTHAVNSDNILGDNLSNSKNCKYCFAANDLENVAYSFA